MRRVYSPPRITTRWGAVGVWAVLLTLGVFLVLPLTQMVSSYRQKELIIRQADIAMEAPPDLDEPPPPPPEEEKPEEPPPPKLADAPQPLNLNIDLDVAMGSGGVLQSLGQFGGDDGGDALMEAFNVADLEKRPEVVVAIPPQYPADMRKAKVEGTVTIVFILDENGRLLEPRVDSSSRPEFEKPALEALRKWKFKPGMKNGEAVRTYMRQPFRFRLGA
jgi:protein TonB